MIFIYIIYTIGYTAFSIKEFIDVITKYGINCLIDVRSSPYSNYYTDYNRELLESVLKQHRILYRNYSKEFGARQTNPAFYSGDTVDFDKFIKSEQFLEGVEKIKNGIEIGYTFVLMCAEKDPINCHRSIMLGKGFLKNGFDVKHILSDKSIESQEELEQRLLDMYHKGRFQFSLFDNEVSEIDLIADAYKKRNIDIGYNRKNDVESGEDE